MNNFLQKHPEAAKHMQGIKEKEAATKALGTIFKASAGTAGATYLGTSLYDLLK